MESMLQYVQIKGAHFCQKVIITVESGRKCYGKEL